MSSFGNGVPIPQLNIECYETFETLKAWLDEYGTYKLHETDDRKAHTPYLCATLEMREILKAETGKTKEELNEFDADAVVTALSSKFAIKDKAQLDRALARMFVPVRTLDKKGIIKLFTAASDVINLATVGKVNLVHEEEWTGETAKELLPPMVIRSLVKCLPKPIQDEWDEIRQRAPSAPPSKDLARCQKQVFQIFTEQEETERLMQNGKRRGLGGGELVAARKPAPKENVKPEQKNGSAKGKKWCSFCKRKGNHTLEECWKANPALKLVAAVPKVHPTPAAHQPSTPSRVIKCYACNQPGHIAAECPNRGVQTRSQASTNKNWRSKPNSGQANARRATESKEEEEKADARPRCEDDDRCDEFEYEDEEADGVARMGRAVTDLAADKVVRPTTTVEVAPAELRDDPDPAPVKSIVVDLNVWASPTSTSMSVPCLIDTGSDVNIVNSRGAEMLKKAGAVHDQVKFKLAGIDGKVQTLVTRYLAHVAWRGALDKPQRRTCVFYEHPGLDVPFLLGCDTSLKLRIIKLPSENEQLRPAENQLLSQAVSAEDEIEDVHDADFEKDKRTVDPALTAKYEALREIFKDVLTDVLPPGGSKLAKFTIELIPGAQLPRAKPRYCSPPIRQMMKEEVDRLVELGVIRPSTSPYCVPGFLVRKPGAKPRLVGDYVPLNRVTVRINFPMPRIGDVLQRLQGAKYFSRFDLKRGFWQVLMEDGSILFTAFITQDGCWEYLRAPMGAANLPQHFARAMQAAFGDLSFVVIYVDDAFIFSQTEDEHWTHVHIFLQRSRQYQVVWGPDKCILIATTITCLSFIVDSDGIRVNPERKRALIEMQAPRDKTSLRSFLSSLTFIAPWLKNRAIDTQPLNVLTGDVPWTWGDEQQMAFEQIKKVIARDVKLYHVDYEWPLYVRTDASKLGVGGVLFQIKGDNIQRPISFVSRAFSQTEQRWSTLEQECYGLVFTIIKHQHFLQAVPFIAQTDHANLLWLDKSEVPKVVRWRLLLQSFDFVVEHIAGRLNIVPDALSRCLRSHARAAREQASRQAQAQAAMEAVDAAAADVNAAAANAVALRDADADLPELVREEEEDYATHRRQFTACHNSLVGHHGREKTVARIRNRYGGWPNMRQQVAEWIRLCALCQLCIRGHDQGSVAGTRATISASMPNERIAIDPIKMPEIDGFKALWVFIDEFSRYTYLYAGKDVTAETACTVLLEHIGREGAPASIRTDQGPAFTSQLFEALNDSLGVTHTLSIAEHGPSNGIVERDIGKIRNVLRAMALDTPRVYKNWLRCYTLIMRLLNGMVHTSIGMQPSRLKHGNNFTLDRHVLPLPFEPRAGGLVSEELVVQLKLDQDAACDAARKHLDRIYAKQLENAPEPREFVGGQYVLARWPGDQPPTKLSALFQGPFYVIEKVGSNSYKVQNQNNLKVRIYSAAQLVPFELEPGVDVHRLAAAQQELYIVREVLAHRWRNGKPKRFKNLEFKTTWIHLPEEQATWEPYQHLKRNLALQRYSDAHPELKIPNICD